MGSLKKCRYVIKIWGKFSLIDVHGIFVALASFPRNIIVNIHDDEIAKEVKSLSYQILRISESFCYPPLFDDSCSQYNRCKVLPTITG